jgi:hypothetical protein
VALRGTYLYVNEGGHVTVLWRGFEWKSMRVEIIDVGGWRKRGT